VPRFALASTLAGNFTLVGLVADLMVTQCAQGAGISTGFWANFNVGRRHIAPTDSFLCADDREVKRLSPANQ
jgi:Na+/H+ antiporter NhaD/arsenite permease-like protein